MELFRYPEKLFWLTLFFVFFIFVYIRLYIRKQKIIANILDSTIIERLIPKKIFTIKKIKDITLLLAMFLIIISVAGPQWEREFSQAQEFSGNILINVDTSLSMSAKDLKPSRIENAKLMLKFLINSLTNYRIAIAAFQDKSYIQCPLTTDIDALNYFIDTLKPNMLPFPGTNIDNAIYSSGEYLSKYSGEKMLVIITDGENHGKNLDNAIQYAKETGIRIFTVGIGTQEGDLLSDENGGYKKDNSGHTVLSKLDENSLLKIAHQTMGQYVRYNDPEFVAEEIKKFADNLKMAKSKSLAKNMYKNHYQIPLFIALLLILIEFIIMEEKFSLKNLLSYGKFILLIAILFISSPLTAKSPQSLAREGNKNYEKKDYAKAYDYYKKAAEKSRDQKLIFNIGDALYKLENYEEADKYFQSVTDPKLKSNALYNLGNSKYMQKDLNEAIKNYKEAILLNPKDKNAKYNLQITLMQKKNNQNKQCNKENKENKKQDKNKDQKEKNQEQKKENQKDEKEKKQAEQLLNMVKEKEKENQKNLRMQQIYNNKDNRKEFTDKDW